MKKGIILVAMVLGVITTHAQRSTFTESTFKTMQLKAAYKGSVDTQTNDTTRFISVRFRNVEYQHITDYKTFMLFSELEVEELKNDVNLILSKTKDKKDNISVTREKYSLAVYDKSKYVYLSCDNGHVVLTPSQLLKFETWLNTLGINLF